MSGINSLCNLRVSGQEAETRLKERIDVGKVLLTSIERLKQEVLRAAGYERDPSSEHTENRDSLWAEYLRWDDFNKKLLNRIFDSPEIAVEYGAPREPESTYGAFVAEIEEFGNSAQFWLILQADYELCAAWNATASCPRSDAARSSPPPENRSRWGGPQNSSGLLIPPVNRKNLLRTNRPIQVAEHSLRHWCSRALPRAARTGQRRFVISRREGVCFGDVAEHVGALLRLRSRAASSESNVLAE